MIAETTRAPSLNNVRLLTRTMTDVPNHDDALIFDDAEINHVGFDRSERTGNLSEDVCRSTTVR